MYTNNVESHVMKFADEKKNLLWIPAGSHMAPRDVSEGGGRQKNLGLS